MCQTVIPSVILKVESAFVERRLSVSKSPLFEMLVHFVAAAGEC